MCVCFYCWQYISFLLNLSFLNQSLILDHHQNTQGELFPWKSLLKMFHMRALLLFNLVFHGIHTHLCECWKILYSFVIWDFFIRWRHAHRIFHFLVRFYDLILFSNKRAMWLRRLPFLYLVYLFGLLSIEFYSGCYCIEFSQNFPNNFIFFIFILLRLCLFLLFYSMFCIVAFILVKQRRS